RTDLPAGCEHAGELVERRLRIGNRGDHVLRDDDVERRIRKRKVGRIHHGKAFDVAQVEFGDPFARLAQHCLGNVDAEQTGGARVVRERDAGPDPDLEHAAADAFRGRNRRLPPALEHRAEHEVIHRRPTGIGFRDGAVVDVHVHGVAFLIAVGWAPAHQPRAVAGTARVVRGPCGFLAALLTWPTNCRALFSHDRASAKARHASREMCSAPRHAARKSSLRTPTGLSAMTSRGPVTGNAATGTPQASASSCTSPKVSVLLGKTNTSAAATWAASAVPCSSPTNFTSGKRRRSSASCGPSPTTTLEPGRSSARKASRFFSTATRPAVRKSGRG